MTHSVGQKCLKKESMLAGDTTFLRATHIAARMASPTDSAVRWAERPRPVLWAGAKRFLGPLPTGPSPVLPVQSGAGQDSGSVNQTLL